MRYDSEHKQKTREAILHEAAGIIRTVGPDKVGIKSIMANAGLTHGGFYAHFGSKDDLVAAAIGMMVDERRGVVIDMMAGKSPREGLHAFIDRYLSETHRRNLANGCPLPALSADVARLSLEAKREYAKGFDILIGLVSERLRALGHREPNVLARSVLTEMIGAVALARTMPDDDAAREILETTRRSVKSRI